MIHVNDHPKSVLVIDDELGIHETLALLFQPDFSVHTATSGEDGLRKIDLMAPDLILLDLQMPRMSGMEVLNKLVQAGQDVPVIIFTAYGSINSAVRAIKLGAVDYIEKPFNAQKLKHTVDSVLNGKKDSRMLSSHQDIIGESPQIHKVWQLVEKYGPTDLPILLMGETGTGKELFANAIHEISKRSQEALVPIDCSTIPETLFESEIFGYERGAFTGADHSKPGQLDWANQGTFFLDEISNLPLPYQAKFLRVVQERQYVPLGAKAAKRIDVRFVSASNINLKEAAENGAFRNDLYYRISGVCIELPPLREREGDIELLVRHFADKYAKRYSKPILDISDEAMELLLSYKWPGNIRELKHTMGSAVVGAGSVVLVEHLPPDFQRKTFVCGKDDRGKARFELSFSCDVAQPIDLKEFKKEIAAEAERFVIGAVEKRYDLTQENMAKFLNIDPKTLRAKLGTMG